MTKKLPFFTMLITATALLFVSCKKNNAELILGTWSNNADCFEETTINGTTEREYYQAGLLRLTFNNNGIVTVTSLDEVSGNADTKDEPYLVIGDKLQWEDEIYTIKQIDFNKMTLEVEEDDAWEENGVTLSIHNLFHMSFDRR